MVLAAERAIGSFEHNCSDETNATDRNPRRCIYLVQGSHATLSCNGKNVLLFGVCRIYFSHALIAASFFNLVTGNQESDLKNKQLDDML